MSEESCKKTSSKNLICDNITSADTQPKSEWIDISRDLNDETAAAIGADLEALFFSSNPHSVKRGSLLANPLKTKGPQKSYPPKSTSPKSGISGVFEAFAFDWIQGVIPNEVGGGDCIVGGPMECGAVARATRFFESIGLRPGQQGTGGKGYRTGLPFTEIASKEKVASIASGSTTGGMPNITISGGRGFCALAAPRLLAEFKGLRITRADTALDLSAPNAFELILDEMKRFAHARKMTPPTIMGADTPEKGRTAYLGSRQSQVYARVYEKGLQLAAAGEPETDPEWVRIEFVFQNLPSRKKVGFGELTPGEMVRAYHWPRKFVEVIARTIGLTHAMEKAEMAKIKMETSVKTLATTAGHGAHQYGNTFLSIAIEGVIRDRFNGDVAAAEANPEELIDLAGDAFKDYLRIAKKAEKVMERYRVNVSETEQQRADAIAQLQQSERLRDMDEQARAANRLALILDNVSQHKDAVEDNKAVAAKADKIHADAVNDLEAVHAEWVIINRKAEAAKAAAYAAAFNDAAAPAYHH